MMRDLSYVIIGLLVGIEQTVLTAQSSSFAPADGVVAADLAVTGGVYELLRWQASHSICFRTH